VLIKFVFFVFLKVYVFKLNHELLKDNEDDNSKIVRDRSGSTGRKHQKFQTKSNNFKNQHSSGVKIFSMCNCGMSRRIRNDPFTLKVFVFNKIFKIIFYLIFFKFRKQISLFTTKQEMILILGLAVQI